MMFPAKPLSDRLPPKTLVLGVWMKGASRAYSLPAFEKMMKAKEVEQELQGVKFTLAWSPNGQSVRILKADEGLSWMYSFWFAWYAFHPETEVVEDLGK